MNIHRPKFSRQTLAATLIVIVIIAMLAVVLMNGSLGPGKSERKDGLGLTLPGAAKLRARDTQCRSNLNQVRAAIVIARSSADDEPPAGIEDLRLGKEFYICPIGKEPYSYDPKLGEAKCVHLGHEKY